MQILSKLYGQWARNEEDDRAKLRRGDLAMMRPDSYRAGEEERCE